MKKNQLLFTGLLAASLTVSAQSVPVLDFSTTLAPQHMSAQLPVEAANSSTYGEGGAAGTVGDFNNDGIDDFILTGAQANDATTSLPAYLFLYLGQKDGTPVKIDLGSQFPDGGLHIGGNGAIDSWKQADGTWIFAVQGGCNGVWTRPYRTSVFTVDIDDDNNAVVTVLVDDLRNGAEEGLGGGNILVLDANGDGFADIFQIGWKNNNDWGDSSVLWLNDGSFHFTEFENHGVAKNGNNGISTLRLHKADFNKDGLLDIAYGDTRFTHRVSVYLSNGDGTFTEQKLLDYEQTGAWQDECGTVLGILDFDNDGYLDIVHTMNIAQAVHPVRFFKNDGTGHFAEIESKNMNGDPVQFQGGQRGFMACADFDRDGNADIIAAVEAAPGGTWATKTYLYSGDGQGRFDQFDITNSIPSIVGTLVFGGVFATGDFDGDGTPDLIAFGKKYNNEPKTYLGDLYINRSVTTGVQDAAQASEMQISVRGNVLKIKGVAGTRVSVYDLSGIKIAEQQVVTDDSRMTLNIAKGFCIVKAENRNGAEARKIVIK